MFVCFFRIGERLHLTLEATWGTCLLGKLMWFCSDRKCEGFRKEGDEAVSP